MGLLLVWFQMGPALKTVTKIRFPPNYISTLRHWLCRRNSALALTASRLNRKDNVCLHRGHALVMGIFLAVEVYFDLCRLENSHVTAAATLLALAALPSMLANAAATTLLALAAAPTVLAAPLPPPHSLHTLRRLS